MTGHRKKMAEEPGMSLDSRLPLVLPPPPALEIEDAPLLCSEDAFLELCRAPRGVQTGIKFRLSGSPVTIGREPPKGDVGRGSAIILPHKSVSRRHARIELRGFSLFLIDEGSMNGTFIKPWRKPKEKGRVYNVAMLRYNDNLYFGHEFMLRVDFTSTVTSPEYLEEVRRESVDHATKLSSRRFLDWHLEREVLDAQKMRQDVALLLLSARERRGARTEPRSSDEFAVQLAATAEPSIPGGAIVGRFGPGELGVLAPGWTAAKISEIGAAVERTAPPGLLFRYGAAELMAGDRDGAEGIRKRAVEALREAERGDSGDTPLT